MQVVIKMDIKVFRILFYILFVTFCITSCYEHRYNYYTLDGKITLLLAPMQILLISYLANKHH